MCVVPDTLLLIQLSLVLYEQAKASSSSNPVC